MLFLRPVPEGIRLRLRFRLSPEASGEVEVETGLLKPDYELFIYSLL